MTQWLQTASDTVSPVLFPLDVRNLILRQNAIGWRNILRGRFSHEWQRIQNDYFMKHRRKAAYKRTGARWQQKLITVIWELWYALWEIRNGEVHGTTEATRAQAQRQEVNRQLTAIFADRAFMEPEVQNLLEADPETQIQRPQLLTKNWLAMVGPVIRSSVRRRKKVSLAGVRSLRTYFQRIDDG